MNWLDELVEQRKRFESPISFWRWAGLATISAVVKDNVWMDRAGNYKLYPNIFVMLHADSGMKKGPPVNLAKKLVKEVNNTRIISGRASIQGILKQLGEAKTQPGGAIQKKSVAFIVSSELTSSLVEDKAAATILTDLYDRHYNEGEWASLLKMETFQLRDTTITMLTATNEAHSNDFFTARDFKGGFFARTFVVYEREVTVINSLVAPSRHPPDDSKLIPYLKELGKLHGEFHPNGSLEKTEEYKWKADIEDETVWLNDAGRYYNDWYVDFTQTIRKQKLKDPTGTINRFGDSVLKIAMLYSLAESTELVVREHHLKNAVIDCERFIGSIRKVTMGSEETKGFAAQKAMIIQELLERDNNMISRTQLMKKYYLHFNANELNEIMNSLKEAGMVAEEMHGNQLVYVMPDSTVKGMQDYLKGKTK